MSFSEPLWLWLLLALPVLLLLEAWGVKRARTALERLVGARESVLLAQHRPRRRAGAAAARLGALALVILGAAGPEWGREVVRRAGSGSDVVLAVDVSASMDARDVAPTRLDEARREALAVLERLGGSRVAVLAFAGDAHRLCPLTTDLAAARLSIESLSSSSVSEPGTDIGRALNAIEKLLPAGRREEQAVVLWTDGEDLEGGARDAIAPLQRRGVRFFVVGVGTPAGEVVPVLDELGRAVDVKRDEAGNAVRSRLDETLLRHIARSTGGTFFRASRPGGEMPRLLAALGGLERSSRGGRLVERAVSQFRWLALPAALLLLFERVRLRPGRRKETGTAKLRSETGAAAAAALLLALLVPRAEAQTAWARGNRAFQEGKFAEAESLYTLRLQGGGPRPVQLNRATARALRGDLKGAVPELENLGQQEDEAGRAANYNLGTLFGREREYDPALRSLRRALEQNPDDEDARWNYELLMQRREQERRRQQPQQPKPKPQQGGSQPQPKQQGTGSGTPPPQGTPEQRPPQAPQAGQKMTRQQAEQILNALEDLTRMEQQRQRKVRVLKERRGRDW